MGFKLLNRARSEGVAGSGDDAVPVVEQPLGNLCRSGGFSGTVDAHQHDDHRDIARIDETANAGVKVPIARLEQCVECTLERCFKHL